MDHSSNNASLLPRVILGALATPVFLVVLVFIPAGAFDYWQGIVFIALNLLFVGGTFVVMRNRPDLINERMKPGEGMPAWDKAYHIVNTCAWACTIILASLDAGRLRISPALPAWAYVVSIAVFALGHILFLWARKTNDYFSSVVRLQKDRGQTVCTAGPYRLVRHPGYAGGLLLTIASPIVLGSLWALLPMAVSVASMLCRTAKEDKYLLAGLAGYTEYAKKVRYRLIPYIW